MLQCTSCSGPPLKKPKVTEMIQPDDDSLRLALAEVRDLQRTVVVLRSELELSHNERQHAVQDALSFAHSEISQLRDTVAALRTSLERLTQEKLDALQQANTVRHAEIAQLHDTIRALRDTLEARA